MDLLLLPRHRRQLLFGVLLALSPAKAQTDGPEHARQLVAEGVRFIQQDQLSEAADRFRKAMKADPNNADAANDLGIVLRRQKHFQEAVTAFESALRLRPGEARIHSNLALALQDLDRIPEAVAAMKRAYALQPGNSTIRRNLGVLDCKLGEQIRQKGDLRGALPQFREAVELAGDTYESHQLLEARCWKVVILPKPRLNCGGSWNFSRHPGRRIETWAFFYSGETGWRKRLLPCITRPNCSPATPPFITI
jgi:Tfp pilus assembly protein PilF